MLDCGHKLLEDCICSKVIHNDLTKFTVNCTDLGFRDVEMLRQLPAETEVLIFTGNNIPTLPWNIFGDLRNLSKLTTIDMSNNKIHEIKGKTYHHVPNVELLILNHNNLKISDDDDENLHHPRVFSNFINLEELHLTNAFMDNTAAELAEDLHDIFANSDLKKLFKLHLEQNEIRSFSDPNVFCDLPNLHDLYLGDNYIPSINFNVSCLPLLRFLDLERNNVSKLTQHDLDAFDRLAPPYRENAPPLMIDVSNNTFRCGDVATVKTLYQWLQRTNVSVRRKEALQCTSTKHGKRYILNLQQYTTAKHARLNRAVTVLLAVLALVLASLLGAYVYVSREKLGKKMKPVFVIVSRKVHYTTIDSQDV